MKIEKNGLYILDNISEKDIVIGPNLSVILFDNGTKDINIEIMNDSRVELYGFLNNIGEYNFKMKVLGENSHIKVGYLLFAGKNNGKLNAKIVSETGASNTNIEKKLISIVGNDGNIKLDGALHINKNLKQVKATLAEQNLFLGSKGQINCIPNLFVESDEVEASHSCKIEKISDEKLFYLLSRGIENKQALNMILESHVKTLFRCIKMVDNDYYENLTNNILETILKGI